MKKLCILFPGQGSQFPGMGKSFFERIPRFREKSREISKTLGFNLEDICNAEDGKLNQTEFTQPAIVSLSALIFEEILPHFANHPLYLVGHSLGEFSAMYASEVYDLETVIDLVKIRGKLMAECAHQNPGKMAALIGGDIEAIRVLADEITKAGDLVQIANYNGPSQTVISGTKEGIESFQARILESKAKRCITLPVSGAFHTILMKPAQEAFYIRLKQTRKQEPKYKVIMNFNAQELILDDLETLLAGQLQSPVRFTEAIQHMQELGVNTYIEIGPGNVLSNMVKRILPEATILSINNLEDIIELEAIL